MYVSVAVPECRAHGSRGAGMVEVLVALLLFSVSILGLLSSQLTAQRGGAELAQQALAQSLGRDAFERLQWNPEAARLFAGSELGAETADADIDCRVLDCDPAQLARWDRADWIERLRSLSTRQRLQSPPQHPVSSEATSYRADT